MRTKKESFELLNSVTELQQKVAALGHDWPDCEILSKNGVKVQGTSSYSGLFQLLQKYRVDYLSGSIFEVWLESDYLNNQGRKV